MADPELRRVVRPTFSFHAATFAMALIAVAMVGMGFVTSGVLRLLCWVLAIVAGFVAVQRMRAGVTVTPTHVEIRTDWNVRLVPRTTRIDVVVAKQSLGWAPFLRSPNAPDLLVLPLAAWSQSTASKSGAALIAALDEIRPRRP
jgi:hypothetical protein